MGEPLHVEEGHLAHHHRAEQLGVRHEHVAHEEPAVRATLRTEPLGLVTPRATRSLATAAKSRTPVPVFLEGRLVPAGAVLPAPRMLATTYTPPRANQARPIAGAYPGIMGISNPP